MKSVTQVPHPSYSQGHAYLQHVPRPPYKRTATSSATAILRNEYGGYMQVPRIPPPDAGICEAILLVLALLLWMYSVYRLYRVWQTTLNFSGASIQASYLNVPEDINSTKRVNYSSGQPLDLLSSPGRMTSLKTPNRVS